MKKLNGLDKYVIFSISILLIYTIAEFITSTITGVEKSTLTTAIFGFFGAPELTMLALIKIFKIRRGDNDTEDDGDSVDDLLCDGIGDTDSDNNLEQEG